MRRADIARLLALAIIWSASFVFIRVLAPVLGPVWVATARLLLGGAALSLAFLERGVGRFLGVTVHGVVSPFAELGADLDKAEQFEAFSRLN